MAEYIIGSGVKYLVQGVLGRGASGCVFQCENTETKKLCAIKIIPSCYDKEKEIARSLLNKNLQSIVQFYDVFDSPQKDFYYIVMEFCNGGSLFKNIHQDRIKFSQKEALLFNMNNVLFLKLAQGVKQLHELNIIHRDIKPENIVIQKTRIKGEGAQWSYQYKLCDLGVSKMYEAQQNQTSETDLRQTMNIGTRLYRAPEMISQGNNQQNQVYGKGVDVWSLGVVLYEMVTGETLFVGQQEQMEKLILDPTGSISQMKKEQFEKFDSNPGVRSLLKNMIQRDPKKRLTITQVIENIQNLGGQRKEQKPIKLLQNQVQQPIQNQNVNKPAIVMLHSPNSQVIAYKQEISQPEAFQPKVLEEQNKFELEKQKTRRFIDEKAQLEDQFLLLQATIQLEVQDQEKIKEEIQIAHKNVQEATNQDNLLQATKNSLQIELNGLREQFLQLNEKKTKNVKEIEEIEQLKKTLQRDRQSVTDNNNNESFKSFLIQAIEEYKAAVSAYKVLQARSSRELDQLQIQYQDIQKEKAQIQEDIQKINDSILNTKSKIEKAQNSIKLLKENKTQQQLVNQNLERNQQDMEKRFQELKEVLEQGNNEFDNLIDIKTSSLDFSLKSKEMKRAQMKSLEIASDYLAKSIIQLDEDIKNDQQLLHAIN